MKLRNRMPSSFFCCGSLALVLFCSRAMALESDSQQPIYIDSDSATYDEKQGLSTYTGNVISTQGSMKVNSNELVVFTKDGEVTKLIWTGTPVHLKQTPNEGGDEITGESLQAEYYPDRSELVLIKKATVWQGDMTYSSELIKYDIKNSLVNAGEKSSDGKRVHVKMVPKAKK